MFDVAVEIRELNCSIVLIFVSFFSFCFPPYKFKYIAKPYVEEGSQPLQNRRKMADYGLGLKPFCLKETCGD